MNAAHTKADDTKIDGVGNDVPTKDDHAMMREAIKVMRDAGIVHKTGGPFGCVIAKNGK